MPSPINAGIANKTLANRISVVNILPNFNFFDFAKLIQMRDPKTVKNQIIKEKITWTTSPFWKKFTGQKINSSMPGTRDIATRNAITPAIASASIPRRHHLNNSL